jgi:hypothetical protein
MKSQRALYLLPSIPDGIYHYVFQHEDWCVVVADEDAA